MSADAPTRPAPQAILSSAFILRSAIPYPLDRAAFRSVLQDGTLISAGMPGFPELSTDQIEAIRQYLRARARQLIEEPAKAVAGPGVSKPGSGGSNASFAGTWEVVVESPVGKQPAKGVYAVEGGKITGTQSSSQGSLDVQGTVDGSHAKWSGTAYVPFPITLEFDVMLDGDAFSGTVKSGPFGTFPVTGTRS